METPLKKALDVRGTRYNWLADQFEMSRATTDSWINGTRIPKLEQAVELCRLLPELSLSDVLWPFGVPKDLRVA